jgi:hypothetical protein
VVKLKAIRSRLRLEADVGTQDPNMCTYGRYLINILLQSAEYVEATIKLQY